MKTNWLHLKKVLEYLEVSNMIDIVERFSQYLEEILNKAQIKVIR